MKRRSFLGFAIGGVVAAPAAILVGERAEGFPKPSGMPAKEEIRAWGQQVTVTVTDADGDAHIRRLMEQQRGQIMRVIGEHESRRG